MSARVSLLHGRASVHHWVDATHRENRADARPLVHYYGWPDRYTRPAAVWRAAINWHQIYLHALKQPSLNPWAPVPRWFIGPAQCISAHEEYGFYGQNTSAGKFGMVMSPSSYPGSASVVARYGNSWLGIPLKAQLVIVYRLWQTYGWSPWTTAPGCGL